MSDELRERVARVLAEFQGEIHEGTWRFYLKDADAALAIIRAETLQEAARVCEEQRAVFLSDEYAAHQPLSSITERFACGQCATAIRALAASSGAMKDKETG